MSQRTKQRKQVGLTLMLYGRPLHPELFRVHRTETAERRAYTAEIRLVDGGHVVEFTAGEAQLTEVVVCGPENMPERGLIDSMLCRGERSYDVDPAQPREGQQKEWPFLNVKYMISTQEEQLPATLYEATRQEILEYAQKRELMWTQTPGGDLRGGTLSALDIERRANELLVQSFHLFDETQMVIKTQGLIEALRAPAKR